MITIFNYADEDGEHVVAHVVDNGELCVEVFPDADPGLGYNVFVPAAEVRRLIAVLVEHWPASGGVVEPSPLTAEEAGAAHERAEREEREEQDELDDWIGDDEEDDRG